MKKKSLILFVFLLASLALPLGAAGWAASSFAMDGDVATPDKNKMTIIITVNNIVKVELQDVPKEGRLEVYSILGVRVESIDLKYAKEGCFIELPKGLYVFRAGSVARKIIIS